MIRVKLSNIYNLYNRVFIDLPEIGKLPANKITSRFL